MGSMNPLKLYLDLQLYLLQLDTQTSYLKLKCKLGKHDMSDWQYPSETMKKHYMANLKYRYCLRNCGHQETEYEFEEDI